MLKIHILGGPGSGKTTLGREISARFHVPHYDLDQLGLKFGMQEQPYISEAFAIAAQDGWVSEGIYLLFTDPLLHAADYIVVLDVSWPLAAWRITRRHIVNSLRGTNQYPGWKTLLYFLRDTRDYYLDKDASDPKKLEHGRLCLEERTTMAKPPDPAFVLKQFVTYRELSLPFCRAFVDLYLERYKEKVIMVKNKRELARLLALLAGNPDKSGRAR